MTKERLLRLSGQELFQRQLKALREGRITFAHLRATSAAWLKHRGYVHTSLGWWKRDELTEMGAAQTQSGEWVIGTEERRRRVGKDGDKMEVYLVVERANAFFARRRAENVKYEGLLTASSPEQETDVISYDQTIFEQMGYE